MKKILSLSLMYFLTIPLAVASQDSIDAEACIADNSGAGSIECLEKLLNKSNQKLKDIEQTFLETLDQRLKNQDILDIHFKKATTYFKKSIIDFVQYRDNSCFAKVHYSGAAASGYSQIKLSCLIEENQLRYEFIQKILKRKLRT